MLPFTKRPGRGDGEIITNDDLFQLSSSGEGKPVSYVKKWSSPASSIVRAPLESAGDDEMTNVIPTKSLGRPLPLPVAGRPSTVPPARSCSSSLRPPPMSVRPSPASSDRPPLDEVLDDDELRTIVRAAPNVFKPSTKSIGSQHASISPAELIKATLGSACANQEQQRKPAPRSERFVDSSPVFERRPVVLSHAVSALERSHASAYPSPSSHAGAFGQSTHRPIPSASASVPAAPSSMPAHFMTPQPPYSNGDPPGTAVTGRHNVRGRPATSWALALLACGLFAGGMAAGIMRSRDSVKETTASFIDPSRVSKQALGPAAAQPAPASVAEATAPSQPTSEAPDDPSAAAPALPATPAPPVPAAPSPPTASGSAPVAKGPARAGAGFASVAVPVSAKSVVAPSPPTRTVFVSKPAAPPAAPLPKAAPVKAASPPVKASESGKGPKSSGKASETDEETRKALEALRKAQLESASSFGE